MAFLGVGKKTPKSPAAAAADPMGSGETAAPVVSKKKGFFGGGRTKQASPKQLVAKPKSRSGGGDLNIYTAVLFAAAVALGAGCALICMDNLSGVEGTGDAGNPFAVVSSR